MSEIFNEDCMVGMARYPDKYFDLAIVDPPYFSGPEKRKYYGKEFSGHGVRRIDYKPLTNSWKVPDRKYFKELSRVSKHQIVWGINYFNHGYSGSGRVVWDKVNDANDFSDCEIAYCSLINHVRIFRYMWNGMMQGTGDGTSKKMQGNKTLNEKRIHPTQKPVMLYKWLFSKYAEHGFRIIDTHTGSCSSQIAADQMHMDLEFIGFELDKDYFEASVKRYNQYKSQINMFA